MKTSLRHSRALRATIAGLLFVAMPTTHLANASIAGARTSAAALFIGLKRQGWECRDTFSQGLLRKGGSVLIATTLHAGNNYAITAGGCEDAYDVDLAVYDESGNRVGADADTSPLALVRVTPLWTGTYYLKVTMASSTNKGAHYVVQYAFRKR